MENMISRVCSDFWPAPRVVGIGNPAPASIAASLVAALFYAQIAYHTRRGAYELKILCRLEAGPHLATLVRSLREMNVQIHYQINGLNYESISFCQEST